MIRPGIKVLFAAMLLLVVNSCVSEIDKALISASDAIRIKTFYATTESSEPETKVFADENLKVLWNKSDSISIFNKNTGNMLYNFEGEEGDNAGEFSYVSGDATSTMVNHIYAVYPYNESTSISNGGVLSLKLPANQSYKENSFGIGANTMVSVTDDNNLLFRNVCGYLAFKFYGDGISVKSITLRGNNQEKLAGAATVTMPLNGIPNLQMQAEATEQITLTCETPVALSADENDPTLFWFVLPPTTLTQGFTVTVTDDQGGTFEMFSTKERIIERNKLIRMAVLRVEPVRQYQIGEIVDIGGKGIVCSVEDEGILLMSVEELKNKNWTNSNTWCKNYGSGGWRMPTISELTAISKYFKTLNSKLSSYNFSILTTQNICYWSSTVNPNKPNYYYRERLSDGAIFSYGNDEYYTSTTNYTRAVKYISLKFCYFDDDAFNAYCVSRFDEDKDGKISQAEAEKVNSINIISDDIVSLGGIGYFTNLMYLMCVGTDVNLRTGNLREMNVSICTQLEQIDVSGNLLPSFSTVGLSSLKSLALQNCAITSVDLSGSPMLEELNLLDNQFVTLDLSGSTNLIGLSFGSDKCTSLDLSGLTKLQRLEIGASSAIETLDISNNENLTYFNSACCSNLKTLYISPTQIIDGITANRSAEFIHPETVIRKVGEIADPVFNAYMLEHYDKDKNGVISNDEAALVRTIDIVSDEIISLSGIEKCTNLNCLRCVGTRPGSGKLQEMDLSKCTKLQELYVQNNQLETLDLSNNKNLGMVDASANPLTSFSTVGLSSLKKLFLQDCSLTNVDLSGASLLNLVNLSGNPLSVLDFSHNNKLTDLDLSETHIATLDFSTVTGLVSLSFGSDQCTSLDLSALTMLDRLVISPSSAIETLDISSIPVTIFNSSGCSNLKTLKVSPTQFIEGVTVNRSDEFIHPDTQVVEMMTGNIIFADANVKAICVNRWDSDNDGELSYEEAASVTNLGLAFRNNTTITSFNELKFFTGLTTIPSSGDIWHGFNGAFEGCTNLKSIWIPENVTSISSAAFRRCGSLSMVSVPKGLEKIDQEAFTYCNSLRDIRFLESAERLSIGKHAFESCEGLTDITIPESIVSMDSYVFNNCKGLTRAKMLSKITFIPAAIFSNCIALESFTIPVGVTEIRWEAFNGCSSLSEIIIPDSVTSIGNNAFSNCVSLKELEIPDSVTSIDSYVFEGCLGLKDLTIPNSVSKIGDYAFKGCRELVSILLPERTERMGKGAFYNCDKLKSVTIPSGVSAIADELFDDCKALVVVIIPESVTTIGNRAFYGCSMLQTITLPISVTSVGDYAFGYCSELKNVHNDNSIVSIGASAFVSCGKLTVDIPSSVTSIGDYAFYNCIGLTEAIIPYGVVQINKGTFYGCTGLTDVTIPSTVTSIGDDVFIGCTNLSFISVPNSVTMIGERAFYGCCKITDFTIPENVTRISAYTFYGCEELTSITIPSRVASIGKSAFFGCYKLSRVNITNIASWCICDREDEYSNPLCFNDAGLYVDGSLITELVIPDGTPSVSAYAFYGQSSITDVTIPVSVSQIGSYAFYGCSGIMGVTIPGGVTSIGAGAFSDCVSMTSISVSDSVTEIGASAFANCKRLSSFVFPQGVSKIESGMFSDCYALSTVTVPVGITSIDDKAFFHCTGLKGIEIPDGVTHIGEYAFSNCQNLARVILPEGLEAIESYCFNNCKSLPGVKIPESVSRIGKRAFYNCSKVAGFILPANVSTIREQAFIGCSELIYIIIQRQTPPSLGTSYASSIFDGKYPIYVPAESVNAYKSDYSWKEVAGRITAR